MKNFLFIAIMFISSFSIQAQGEFDVKLKTSALFLESSIAAQAEYGLSPHFSGFAGLGYNNIDMIPNFQRYLFNNLLDGNYFDSGLLGEVGLRYYSRPYQGSDQAFLSGSFRYQGPSEKINQNASFGLSGKFGTKHVFTNRLFVETFIGLSFALSAQEELVLRSSMPLFSYGINLGYRIQGESLKGTAEYYGKKSKSVKSRKSKKKKKRRRRRR